MTAKAQLKTPAEVRNMNVVAKYQIFDSTTKTDSYTDDIVEAIGTADFLCYKMNHPVTVTNRQTGQMFAWTPR